jgi:hypothetical protein
MKKSMPSIVFSVISFFIGVSFIYIGWEAFLEYSRIHKYGGLATGYITHKHFQRASDGNSLYYLEYSFTSFDGRKITSKQDVIKDQWDVLKVNDVLQIRYDKSNPERNIPLSGGGISLAYVFLVSLLGAVFVIFGVMRLFMNFGRRDHKLSNERF